MAIWLNKFLSGEFCVLRRNGHYLVKSAGLAAIQTNKFLTGEFCVFCGKVIIIGFGHCHRNFGGKLGFGRTKFILFVVKVTDWVVS